jgi:hypothetical protein
VLVGELLIALTRAFPATVHSNQARWYAREIANTPSIYVLFPEQFQDEARQRVGANDPRLLEGKHAVTFIYLARQQGAEQVAKTLLLDTETTAPMYRAQVAHELLNCACASDWDGAVMRSGVRLVNWGAGAPLQRGGMLNDLLIDILLLDFLPQHTNYTRESLLEGTQGPYWRSAAALSAKVPQPVILAGLFGPDTDRLILEGYLNEVIERGGAAQWLDQLILNRDWSALADAVGAGEAV